MTSSLSLVINELAEGFWARERKTRDLSFLKDYSSSCVEDKWQRGKNGSRKTSLEAMAPVQTRDDVPWTGVMEGEIKRSRWIWGSIAKRLDAGDKRRWESQNDIFWVRAVRCHPLKRGRREKGEGSQGLCVGCAAFDKTIRHPSGTVRSAFGLYKWVWSSRERSELPI